MTWSLLGCVGVNCFVTDSLVCYSVKWGVVIVLEYTMDRSSMWRFHYCEPESGWIGRSQGVAAVSVMDDGDNVSIVDNGDNDMVIVCGSPCDCSLL